MHSQNIVYYYYMTTTQVRIILYVHNGTVIESDNQMDLDDTSQNGRVIEFDKQLDFDDTPRNGRQKGQAVANR